MPISHTYFIRHPHPPRARRLRPLSLHFLTTYFGVVECSSRSNLRSTTHTSRQRAQNCRSRILRADTETMPDLILAPRAERKHKSAQNYDAKLMQRGCSLSSCRRVCPGTEEEPSQTSLIRGSSVVLSRSVDGERYDTICPVFRRL